MTWEYFYQEAEDWNEKTFINRICSLEDSGTAEQVRSPYLQEFGMA